MRAPSPLYSGGEGWGEGASGAQLNMVAGQEGGQRKPNAFIALVNVWRVLA